VWEYMTSNLAPGLERRWSIRGDGKLRAGNSAMGTITGAICYDMDFPAHIRQAGSMDADLLLAPANDWSQIQETHWRMARMRAIENGVSILRPSSNGVSTAINPFGRVVSRVNYFESRGGPIAAVLPVVSIGTVYTRIGDSWTWVFIVGGAFLIVRSTVRWLSVRRISCGSI
jgi:apolipoprotein N-acyltransferase